jgi:2-phosphoglycerate kinase
MIYLIGGPPKCGKTTLAKRLSKSAGIPWVSADSLQNVIKPYIAEQDMALKFPLSAMKYASNDEKYAAHSSAEIIAAYRQQAANLEAAIEAFAKSELTDGNDYILEGYQVTPEVINQLTNAFPEEVRGLIVVKKDPTAFLADIHKSTTPNDWILSKTHNDATFLKIATMVTNYSAELENTAKENAVKVFCVDKNFDSELEAAARYLADANDEDEDLVLVSSNV